MKALEIPYEDYLAISGIEACGICGSPRKGRKLDRDHDHKTGLPRGLLCHRCNRSLPRWVTPEWLDKAAGYLEADRLRNLDRV
jgi:hypothetical protein